MGYFERAILDNRLVNTELVFEIVSLSGKYPFKVEGCKW